MRKAFGILFILVGLLAAAAAFGPPGRENMGGLQGMHVILGGSLVGFVVGVLLLRGSKKA